MERIVDVSGLLKEFSDLPKFPDGRIDYSGSDKAPVIICFVKHKDEILLLKRSDKVRAYQGLWNGVGGYIDEVKSIEDKAREELNEELGLSNDIISQIKTASHYEFFDKAIGKTWIIFPVLVKVKEKLEIKLDWEHTEYKWIKPEDLRNYKTVPELDKALKVINNQ